MKTLTNTKSKQTGSYIAEVAVGLLIILTLATYGFSKNEVVTESGEESVLIDQITSIANGARKFKKAQPTGYTNLSMTNLSTDSYILSTLSDGVGKNPWGGNLTVAKDATDGTLMNITATGLPTGVCNRLADFYNQSATATCSTGTLSVKTS